MPLDIDEIRGQFPALRLQDGGVPRVYFDNPGGTQVPYRVIERMRDYLVGSNANRGGFFRTSEATDALVEEAHAAAADLLNAPSAREIVYGPNMTTLTFALSRALALEWAPGDEVIVSRMDHDANVAPWLRAAEERGAVVRRLAFDPESYRFEPGALEALLTERTRLVAVCLASNAIGTINDVRAIAERAHAAGALVYVDAVAYVPHAPTDVQALGCDFLVCSPYKFFGPHQGILWGRAELLERLRAYKVRPASDRIPHRFETGTQSHEGQAGTLGAIEYLSWIGGTMALEHQPRFAELGERRAPLHAALAAIAEHEATLGARFLNGIRGLPGFTVRGITDPFRLHERVPTFALTHEALAPDALARRLGAENIFTWHGHYYAVEVVAHLGLAERGGMLRVGFAHYNTAEEVDRLLEELAKV